MIPVENLRKWIARQPDGCLIAISDPPTDGQIVCLDPKVPGYREYFVMGHQPRHWPPKPAQNIGITCDHCGKVSTKGREICGYCGAILPAE